MTFQLDIPHDAIPIGYSWLRKQYELNPLPHWVESYVGTAAEKREVERDGRSLRILPKRTRIPESWLGQLEFAIRNEGLDLPLLRQLFRKIDPASIVSSIQEHPTSKHLRKIWYLYEEITQQELMLPGLSQGNYVDLLDSKIYFAGSAVKCPRQRINVNLLGDLEFCGFVRRTPSLETRVETDLVAQCREVIARFPPELFERAMNYLYRKETKSSFEIENEKPDQARSTKFLAMLKTAGRVESLRPEFLIELQNLIVDPRFASPGYRDATGEQIYVGQSVGLGKDLVHFVGPKPEDTSELMEAWMNASNQILNDTKSHPIVGAAIIAFGFVFIHPFNDGNGRIHRFLIHHVLAKRGFAPDSMVFPVSAIMLKQPRAYDTALESFSIPLMERVEYEQDGFGTMTVTNETADLYRSIDYTVIVEALFDFVAETIRTELPGEFEFLESYDAARTKMKEIVDLPDRVADLFIRLLLQNRGSLSRSKRDAHGFERLEDNEIQELEKAVRAAFQMSSDL
ncbi:MAG: Fic family protein [Verrucomicrobiales bacterium]|nr:Fic family protein [Verrucomicrobiales bacterium]